MITRRGRRGRRAASLTSARGLKLRARSHDDGLGVPRLRGMRPLILWRPPASVLRGGTGRSDRLTAGAGRDGAPSDDDGARSAPIRGTGDHQLPVTPWRARRRRARRAGGMPGG